MLIVTAHPWLSLCLYLLANTDLIGYNAVGNDSWSRNLYCTYFTSIFKYFPTETGLACRKFV